MSLFPNIRLKAKPRLSDSTPESGHQRSAERSCAPHALPWLALLPAGNNFRRGQARSRAGLNYGGSSSHLAFPGLDALSALPPLPLCERGRLLSETAALAAGMAFIASECWLKMRLRLPTSAAEPAYKQE